MDIKQFSLLRLIGKGAYGSVFLAKKKDNNKVYAIKQLKIKDGDKKKQKEHVMMEKQILYQAPHQFIVKISYTFQSEKNFYFALQYCPGGDLFTLLSKRRRLKEEQVQFYAILLVCVISFLHNSKIIYRDLKPENILIDERGYIKLTDFGLSKILESDTANDIVGTAEYLAPEILTKKGYDYKVDCWSLGCLLYEMVGGLPPFMSEKRVNLIEMIKNEEPNYDFPISPDLRFLIQQLLQKDARNRPTMEEVKKFNFFQNVDDWQDYLNYKITPPFLPVINGPEDVNNFDTVLLQLSRYTHNKNYLALQVMVLILKTESLAFLGIIPNNELYKKNKKKMQDEDSQQGFQEGPSKKCNCKHSKCIKLYCECYQAKVFCDHNCHCHNCFNNSSNARQRMKAMLTTLEKNPSAFQPKITTSDSKPDPLNFGKHNKGCQCKKSGCMKKYCECFQAKVPCTDQCKCCECRNYGFLTKEHFLRTTRSEDDDFLCKIDLFQDQLLLTKDQDHLQSVLAYKKPLFEQKEIEEVGNQIKKLISVNESNIDPILEVFIKLLKNASD